MCARVLRASRDVLADLEVALAAARQVVVERLRGLRQRLLVHQVVRHVAERLAQPVVAVPVDRVAGAVQQPLAAASSARRCATRAKRGQQRAACGARPRRGGSSTCACCWRSRYITQVLERIDDDLRALALEELEHPEVAVALGGLRPELAGDLDDRLHAQPIHLDRVERAPGTGASRPSSAGRRGARACSTSTSTVCRRHRCRRQRLPQPARAAARRRLDPLARPEVVGRAPASPRRAAGWSRRGRPRRAGSTYEKSLSTSAAWNAFSAPRPSSSGQLQPRLARLRLHAVVLLEREDAEAVEPRVAERQLELGLVHPEAARAAAARREEDVRSTMSWRDMPAASSSWRCLTSAPTVK